MLKEIHEQPRVLPPAAAPPCDRGRPGGAAGVFGGGRLFTGLQRVMAISCGTAYHAAMYGKLLLESLCDLAVETDLGSEFRYRQRQARPERTLVLAVSQSGETADTLASVRHGPGDRAARSCPSATSPGSSLVRESDAVLFTEAGPEIGVASTKAYTTQLMAFALLAMHVARVRGRAERGHASASWRRTCAKVPDAHPLRARPRGRRSRRLRTSIMTGPVRCTSAAGSTIPPRSRAR